MTRTECQRGTEILEILSAGAWPERCDAEFRQHVRDCSDCAELVLVATALTEERHSAARQARLPGSGLVWWRMQMRERREAERMAARTLITAQAVVMGCAMVVAIVILAAMTRSSPDWASWADAVSFSQLVQVVNWGTTVVIALVAWVMLAPVAFYFAVTEE